LASKAKKREQGPAMIQLFHKILCPIDFSEHSLAALDVALKVALQNDTVLYLLNVAPMQAGAVGLQPVPMDPCPFLEKDRQEQLAKLGRNRLPAAVRYDTIVVTGDPAEQVLNTARRLGADLIVMGTHGRRLLSHLVLGSVAERVVRESAIPVLTARSVTRARKAA
jgi:universal stress protein A